MISRGGSRTAATSKVELFVMIVNCLQLELFVMIVNGFQPFSIITKSSTLDVAAVLDLFLISMVLYDICLKKCANKLCYVLLILFLYAGSGFSWVSPTLTIVLF